LLSFGLMLSRNFICKILNQISIFYSEKQKSVVFQMPKKLKLVNLFLKLCLSKSKKYIFITNFLFFELTQHKKIIPFVRIKCLVSLKKAIVQILILPYRQIFFFGIGFKATVLKKIGYSLLKFNIGFSHNVFVKIDPLLEICSIKLNSFVLSSPFYNNIIFFAYNLKNLRKIDSYKTKGIYFEHSKFFVKKLKS